MDNGGLIGGQGDGLVDNRGLVDKGVASRIIGGLVGKAIDSLMVGRQGHSLIDDQGLVGKGIALWTMCKEGGYHSHKLKSSELTSVPCESITSSKC